MNPGKLALAAEGVPAVPFAIPGATGAFRIQLLNQDAAAGVVTSIIHLPPGGRIPAHRHSAGSEMHYVLEGALIEGGREFGPGSFLTHGAGQVHGPHESRGGAKVLTVQSWQSRDGDYDFEPVEETEGAPTAAGSRADAGEMRPLDQQAQTEARRDEGKPEARGYS
ncbi:cupin domain-containing protein [Falsiroseomonas oryziterrae]|uniref:cupin domain-containing protein n=1 Tax=Falsiroseomonas oryziterrae TaxID=2911368 RepID=UPI001F1B7324|nr:cupin domain-containing protein [Roseomonas sp. NPKOSM-4]